MTRQIVIQLHKKNHPDLRHYSEWEESYFRMGLAGNIPRRTFRRIVYNPCPQQLLAPGMVFSPLHLQVVRVRACSVFSILFSLTLSSLSLSNFLNSIDLSFYACMHAFLPSSYLSFSLSLTHTLSLYLSLSLSFFLSHYPSFSLSIPLFLSLSSLTLPHALFLSTLSCYDREKK